MHPVSLTSTPVENLHLESSFLQRNVIFDIYYSINKNDLSQADLLLINDGQDMPTMGFAEILEELSNSKKLSSLIAVAIHAGNERKMEYGIASQPDFKGRGAKAALYTSFVLDELLPYLSSKFSGIQINNISIAGFSLGGLSAMDIAWNHPAIFKKVGVFSGSFWWRSLDQTNKNYRDDIHRIMHQVIRKGNYHPWQQFFFQCGNMDETRDRNKNGIIDSIDDTLDLIKELEAKGYEPGKDIRYLELKDGRHDVPTWGRAMPDFLEWMAYPNPPHGRAC